MQIIFGILVALAVFFAVVMFHELGHFLAARRSGVKVEEFGLGIPPKARSFGRDKHGCEYTLNWLPIGGFVRLKGEDELAPTAAEPDSFASKSYFAKSSVILAGVFFNFVLAFLVFTVLFWIWVAPLAVNSKFDTRTETLLVPSLEKAVEVGIFQVSGIDLAPVDGSPAQAAGIREGDRLVTVEGRKIATPKEFVEVVKSHQADADGIQLEVSRSGSVSAFSILPKEGKIGTYVTYADLTVDKSFQYRMPFPQAVAAGAKETVAQTGFTFELLFQIIRKIALPKTPTERTEAVSGVGGPIAIGGLFVKLVEADVGTKVILVVAALLSINLGAFNLLPFPALDGGRFFVMTLLAPLRSMKTERILKAEARIHQTGFAFLILLAAVVAFHDVWKLVAANP